MKKNGLLNKNTLVVATLLVCIGVICTIYSNSLNAEFVFDDKPAISDNYDIRMKNINIDSILTSMNGNRPISTFSFAINYYLHNYSVQGYHIVNIIIHIINSILVFFLFNKILIIAGYKYNWERRWIPVLTTCLWAVNPVHVQSVTYIVQRMTSLATMFYLASFILYLTARTTIERKKKVIFFILSVAAGILSVLSKEIAVTLPCFILFFEWVFFRNGNTKLLKKYILPVVVFFLFSGIIVFFIFQSVYSDFITSGYSDYNFDMIQRCLTQFRVVLYYIGLLFFPHPERLNVDYDFVISNSIIDPVSTLIAMIIVAALLIAAFYMILSKRLNNGVTSEHSKSRLIAFCILWYFGNLFIESSFIPLHMVYEHRTYLPSILLFLMLIISLVTVLKNRPAIITFTVFCMIVCSYWTIDRNKDWRTNESLWLDNSFKSPEKAAPYFQLGACFERKKDWETAYKYYLKAIEKDPSFEKTYINIGMHYYELGKYTIAHSYIKKALELKPNNINTVTSMGSVLVKLKQYQLALQFLNTVLKSNPNHLLAHTNLGELYFEENKLEKALAHYNIALKLEPEMSSIYYNRGLLYKKMNKTDLAIEDLTKAIDFDTEFTPPHISLGRIYTSEGHYDKAITHFKNAVRIDANSVDCHEQWAALLLKTGDTEEAISHFKKIIEIEPKNSSAYQNIGAALFNNGRVFEGLANLTKAIQIEPDSKEVKQNYHLMKNRWLKIPIQERIDIVDRYIIENKNAPFAFAELGKLYYANKEYLKSLKNLKQLLILEPENFMAMNNIAVCYMTNRMFLKAVEMYKSLIQIQPDNQTIWYNLACAYSASGKFNQSIKTIKTAISKGFSDIEYMRKDPDLSRVLESKLGRKFLRELDSQT